MVLYWFGQVRAIMLRPGMRTSSICNTQHVATRRGQTRATCCAEQCCNMLRRNVAIFWPGFANTEPIMLRYVTIV